MTVSEKKARQTRIRAVAKAAPKPKAPKQNGRVKLSETQAAAIQQAAMELQGAKIALQRAQSQQDLILQALGFDVSEGVVQFDPQALEVYYAEQPKA